MNNKINIPEFKVSDFNRVFKEVIESNFNYVRIKGEISEIKTATKGQIYLTLKDQDSILSGVIWDQKKKIRDQTIFSGPGLQKSLLLYIFAFMDRWFGIFRASASALGSLEPPKPYGSCHLATRRRPNLTHTMIWRPKGTQTLRKLSFGD